MAFLQSLLDFYFIFIAKHPHFVFTEDAEDQSVHDQPAVFPEQAEEALYLIQGNDRSKDTHDPSLAYHQYVDFIFKMLH